MGRQFEPKYFQSAIDMYTFLLKQYPRTQYRAAAIFAIAEIQQEDLDQTELAVATYKDLLKRFPKSDKVEAARAALKQISDAKIAEAQGKQATHLEAQPRSAKPMEVSAAEAVPDFPPVKGDVAEPRESDKERMPYITGVRTWNSPGHTRIVVAVSDTVKFESMHVASPERLYFDLHKAQVDPKADKSPKVDAGLLKSVHFGQNKPTVVRVVLDVGGALNYSTQFLSNPYRLVIDVRTDDAAREAAAPRVDDPKSAAKAAESVRANSHNATPPPPAKFSGRSRFETCDSEIEGESRSDRRAQAGACSRAKAEPRRAAFAHARAGTENQPHRDRSGPRRARHGNDWSARTDGKGSVPRRGAAARPLDRAEAAQRGSGLHAHGRHVRCRWKNERPSPIRRRPTFSFRFMPTRATIPTREESRPTI